MHCSPAGRGGDNEQRIPALVPHGLGERVGLSLSARMSVAEAVTARG